MFVLLCLFCHVWSIFCKRNRTPPSHKLDDRAEGRNVWCWPGVWSKPIEMGGLNLVGKRMARTKSVFLESIVNLKQLQDISMPADFSQLVDVGGWFSVVGWPLLGRSPN